MNVRLDPLPIAFVAATFIWPASRATQADETSPPGSSSPPAYQRRATWHDGHRGGHGGGHRGKHGHHAYYPVAPPARSSSFQRPYPYHLDYYRKQYGGDYSPYFGFLYGTPQVFAPQSGYAPFYGGGYPSGPYGGGPVPPGGVYPGYGNPGYGNPGYGNPGGQAPFPAYPPAGYPQYAPAPGGTVIQPSPPGTASPPSPSAASPATDPPAPAPAPAPQ